MSSHDSARFTPDTREPVTLEAGDICIAASYSEGEVDIRRNSGVGRVLVYDQNLTVKGALWTDDQGLVIGLAYCPKTQTLIVSDVASQTVRCFSRDGTQRPAFPDMQGKPFGPIAVAKDGTVIIGEHIKGDKPPFMGGGEIYEFSTDGLLRNHYSAENDPGKFGFHGVTNMALLEEDNGAQKTVLYISETGKRVMQYDLSAGRQADDLFLLDDDGDKSTAGISVTPEGDILLATVYGAGLYDRSGKLTTAYDIPSDRGWSAVRVAASGEAFYIANFFTGRLEKRSLKTGDILAATDTGLVYRLAAIAEII